MRADRPLHPPPRRFFIRFRRLLALLLAVFPVGYSLLPGRLYGSDKSSVFRGLFAGEKPAWLDSANEGNRLWEEGDLEGAVEHWEAAVALGYRDGRAYRFLGSYFYREGRTEKALEYLRPAAAFLEHEGGDAEVIAEIHHLLGSLYLEKRDHRRALVYFRRANRSLPDFAPPYLGLGWIHLMRGETEAARRNARRALELDEDQAGAWLLLARAAEARGEILPTVDYYRRFLDSEPRHREARLSIASILYLHLEERGEAEEHLKLVLEEDPGSLEARTFLASILLERGEAEAAGTAAREILELDPENYRALLIRGRVCLEKGDPGQAEGYFRRALRITPRSAAAFYGLGVAALNREDYSEAEKNLRLATEAAPGLWSALHDLAVALEFQGQRDEAIDLLRRAVKRDPSHRSIQLALGKFYYLERKDEEAVKFLRNAVALGPGEWEPYYYLGKTDFSRGRYASARDYFLRARGLDPGNPALELELGLTYERLGEPEKAEESLQRALEISPRYIPALFHLALFRFRRRQFSDARELYRRAVLVRPGEAEWGYREERGDFAARMISGLDEHLSSGLDYFDFYLVIKAWSRDRRVFRELIPVLGDKIESNPLNPRYYHLLGLAYHELGDFEKAEENYRWALFLDYDLAPAHLSLGELYASQDRVEPARSHLKAFRTLLPDSPFSETVAEVLKGLPASDSPAPVSESLD